MTNSFIIVNEQLRVHLQPQPAEPHVRVCEHLQAAAEEGRGEAPPPPPAGGARWRAPCGARRGGRLARLAGAESSPTAARPPTQTPAGLGARGWRGWSEGLARAWSEGFEGLERGLGARDG